MNENDRAAGPYDDVTIPDVFAWMDTLRGWDIATHIEYETLRDIALRQYGEMAQQLAEAEQKVELYEWAAYQRRRIPSITDDEIMRLTYVPEWRDHDDK